MEKIDIVVPACMYNSFLCIYIQNRFIHGLRLLLLIASKLHSHVFFIDDNVIHIIIHIFVVAKVVCCV